MGITTLEDRVTIEEMFQAGHKHRHIAQQVGVSVSTVRKWLRRARKETGSSRLLSQMGRPAKGALSTFHSMVRHTLETFRDAHPGWGPSTLHAELERDESVLGMGLPSRLPSRATIARWIAQQGLSRSYERHQDLPEPHSGKARFAHQTWEMDARGYQKIADVGIINLINISDRYSRAKVFSYPCWVGDQRATRHPNTGDYQLVFRLAASRWGLPEQLAVDRDSVFYDNRSRSPYPTRFHMWIMALGVELVIGKPRRPTERAMIERSHQTWTAQVLLGQSFTNLPTLEEALESRLDFLNYNLPCSSLGGVPPLVACPGAATPRRLYRPQWEVQMLELDPVYEYLSQGRWFRKGSNVGAVSLGGKVYALGSAWARKQVVIKFDPNDHHLEFTHGQMETRHPIKGITKAELVGEHGPLVNLDRFQLALPFSWDQWQVLRLCETIGVTT